VAIAGAIGFIAVKIIQYVYRRLTHQDEIQATVDTWRQGKSRYDVIDISGPYHDDDDDD
jgi:hypothetical protein